MHDTIFSVLAALVAHGVSKNERLKEKVRGEMRSAIAMKII